MKKCKYQIHAVIYEKQNSEPIEYDYHYDTAIDAVRAWDLFKDDNGSYKRVLTFVGAAGDMAFKHFPA